MENYQDQLHRLDRLFNRCYDRLCPGGDRYYESVLEQILTEWLAAQTREATLTERAQQVMGDHYRAPRTDYNTVLEGGTDATGKI